MLTTQKNISRLVTLALAFAAAAVFTTAASAKFYDSRPQGYLGVTQQNAATGGGVTPTNLARAVARESNAPAGVTPTDLARAVSREDGVTPPLSKAPQVSDSEAAWNFSLSDRDRAIGFGLGLALAIALSLALVMGRNRIRIAHS
jgi:hypothetical protein